MLYILCHKEKADKENRSYYTQNGPNPEHLMISNSAKKGKQAEFSFIAGRNENGVTVLGDSLVAYWELKL